MAGTPAFGRDGEPLPVGAGRTRSAAAFCSSLRWSSALTTLLVGGGELVVLELEPDVRPRNLRQRLRTLHRRPDHRTFDARRRGTDIVEGQEIGRLTGGTLGKLGHSLRPYGSAGHGAIAEGFASTKLFLIAPCGRRHGTACMSFRSLASTLALALASPAAADVLIDNVEGLTIGEDGKVKRFTALVIDDDGTIAQVLTAGDKAPQTDYREDGEGAVMIPGLIDAHAHVMGIGIGALTLDLSDTNSLEEALDKIRAFAAENEARPWILGRGWNQEKWGLGRFPTAAELDRAVADRPVYLQRVDGHAGWANTLAMEVAGIDARSKSPAGGRIERVPVRRCHRACSSMPRKN